MPNFTWTQDAVAVDLPRNPVLIVLGLVAVFMLLTGLRNKQRDMTSFGLVMAGLAVVAYKFLPDPLEIRWYSLLFVGVFLGGYSLLNWQIRRGGGDDEVAGDFIVYGVLGVLVGSRLGHVIFYDLDHALEDPVWVLKIWTGGLASHGAVVGLILAMYLFTRRRGVPFLEGADRFAFSAALGATLVRLGNFFNSEIVGRKTNADWGVRFIHFDGPDAPLRHPSQLYEVALGLLVMLCLYLADRYAGKEKRPRGLLISVFFVVYFAGRFLIEFVKEHQTLSTDSALTMGQYLSIPGFFLGVYGLHWSLQKRLPAGWPSDEDEDEDDEAFDDEDDELDEDPAEDLEDEDDGPDEDRKRPVRAKKKRRLYDADVDDEFEGGRSKRGQQGEDDARAESVRKVKPKKRTSEARPKKKKKKKKSTGSGP